MLVDLEQKAAECRKVLFLTDHAADREKSGKSKLIAGTCSWILQNADYNSWKNSNKSLLWISGGPGKGKTMLAIFITEELEKMAQAQEDAKLIYYFCSHEDPDRRTANAVFRGLLRQIIEHCPAVAVHVLPLFESPAMTERSLSSLETLWICFQKCVVDPKLGLTWCVVDGLDECSEDDQIFLKERFVQLDQDNNAFKLIVVTRDIPEEEDCVWIELDHTYNEYVANDVNRFILGNLDRLKKIRGFTEKAREEVRKTLSRQSEGIFLWVGFAITELSKKKTYIQMQQVLKSLPKGLPQMYSRMLLQIDDDFQSTCINVLHWAALASRPLKLLELADAIELEAEPPLDLEQTMRDILTLCEPILEIRDRDNGSEVHLVHQSAKDFLLQHVPPAELNVANFRISYHDAHLSLARKCLQCVSESSLQDDFLHLRGSHLLHYAIAHWPYHVRDCDALSIELLDDSDVFFREESKLRYNWCKAFEESTSESCVPSVLLHLACYLGLRHWVRALLGKTSKVTWSPDVNQQLQEGRTPLHFAVHSGDRDLVQTILEHQPDIEAKIDEDSRTVLHEAISRGSEAIVHLLLESKANVAAVDSFSSTVLHMVTKARNVKSLINLLVRHGANLDAQDALGSTPLRHAAGEMRIDVVESLLGHNADVQIADASETTPLHCACLRDNRNAAMAKLLLKRNANINARDAWGETPLHRAVEEDNMAVAQLLLARKADTNAVDMKGRTALHKAVEYKRKDIAQLLLKSGIDSSIQDKNGQTAMIFALSWHRFDIDVELVEVLLDGKVDWKAHDISGETAIHYAAALSSQGREGIIKQKLINAMAGMQAESDTDQLSMRDLWKDDSSSMARRIFYSNDIPWLTKKEELQIPAKRGKKRTRHQATGDPSGLEARDKRGQTLLHRAVLNGQSDKVRQLIATGADVDAQDQSGRTPLHLAVTQGRPMLAADLLDFDANHRIKDLDGKTALQWAVSNSQTDVILFMFLSGVKITHDVDDGAATFQLAEELGNEIVQEMLLLEILVECKFDRMDLENPLKMSVESVQRGGNNGHEGSQESEDDLAQQEEGKRTSEATKDDISAGKSRTTVLPEGPTGDDFKERFMRASINERDWFKAWIKAQGLEEECKKSRDRGAGLFIGDNISQISTFPTLACYAYFTGDSELESQLRTCLEARRK